MPLTIEEKKSITKGFETAGERMSDIETGLSEMKAITDQLAKMVSQTTKAFLSGHTESGQVYNRFWPTDEAAKEFGEIVLGVIRHKALSEGVAFEGGYLIPEHLSQVIIQALGRYGKFRKHAVVAPMGSDRVPYPKVESDLTIYCPGEGQEITASDIKFSQVGLTAKKFAALVKVSTELNEDSIIGVAEIVGISAVRSMTKREDAIGFIGDGTSTYFGMTGITGSLLGVDGTIGNIKGLKVGTGNTYSELTLDDFEDVVAILPDDADENAHWFVNRRFFFSVMYRLARAAGAIDMFSLLSPQKQRYFMSYPVEFVSAMPSTEDDSQICAILGDLKLGAFLGERRKFALETSEHAFFVSDQVAFKATERIDINAYGVGDTTEAGPIVGLITAAS